MIKFRQIEVFQRLMATGTTTRAARELSISQPAVSRHISDLESHLGFKLFNRIKGRLEPTTSAVQFANIVEQNFLGLQRIEHAAENIRNSIPQPVVISCIPALSTSILPKVATMIMQTNPTTSLHIDTGNVPEIIQKLQSHSADLALTLVFPPILGIEVEPFFTVDHVCAIPEEHELARKDVITAADFEHQSVIGWSEVGPLRFDKEATIFDEYLSSKDIRITTQTSHTRYAMVAAGLGITIAEPFASGPWLNNGIVLRRFEPKLELTYGLCYPTGRIRSESVAIVRKAIVETMRKLAVRQFKTFFRVRLLRNLQR